MISILSVLQIHTLIEELILMAKISCAKVLLCLLCVTSSDSALSAVLAKNKMWPTSNELNVVFIDGSDQQKNQVKAFAPLWLQDSNLSFSFYDGFNKAPKQTHIRISFQQHTGSQLGDHGDYLSKQPTLLLNQLNQTDLPEHLVRRVVLHEFGHALGFEHEYRNPKWPFGYEAIQKQITDCVPRMEKIGYSRTDAEKQCQEINQPLDKNKVHSTIYDELSIMNYPQRISLKDGSFKQIFAKNKLSVLDKLAIERWYGKKTDNN